VVPRPPLPEPVAAAPTPEPVPPDRIAAARVAPEPEQAPARPRRVVTLPPVQSVGAPWRIVLDPGHGGNDPGARGVDGLLEKAVTLAIARRVKERLEQELNATVLLTRDGDETRSLADRTAFANASRADLFISIHANADEAGRLQGIETYTLNNSNDRATIRLAKMENGPQLRIGRGDLSFILSDMVQSSKEEESIGLAERLHSRVLARLRARYPDVRNLGVKKGPFYVLVGAYMPCVLIETSFLTHPVEGKRLASEEYQADIAEGVYLGVRDFLADARLAKTL
jgi:N-acetylmuramoyl-L-alanine amidase